MRKRRDAFSLAKDEHGMTNLLVTLYIMPVMLFMTFAIVPFFTYSMKRDHLHTIANHALKEAEAVGYVSPTIITNTNAKLAALGLGAVTVGGTSYPSYSGSTMSKVLQDSTNPTVTLTMKYPAPNLTKFLNAVGGGGGSNVNEGFYYIVLSGRSEAYN